MIYIFRSFDCKALFPANTSSAFSNCLLKREIFSPNAHVCLKAIILPGVAESCVVYLFSSVVSYTQLGEQSERILQILNLEKSEDPQKFEFSTPLEFKLLYPEIDEIKFSFKDKSNNLIIFNSNQDTIIVLEIK